MRIAMVTEGTYPHVHGGVSVWCDQIVRGLPEHSFQLVALTGNGGEPCVWELPGNLSSVVPIPLWGPPTPGRTPRGMVFNAANESCELLIDALFEPYRRLAQASFVSGLQTWSRLAPTYRLDELLTSRPMVEWLLHRWAHDPLLGPAGGFEERVRPSVSDAVVATRLMVHVLRPLSWQPPLVDVVHLVANGLAGLVGLSAKWRHRTPFLLSEHGIYLRERYLAFQDSPYSWPVRSLMLRFYRLLTSTVYREAELVVPCNVYNQRWELRDGVADHSVRTVYNGVDPSSYDVAEDEPTEPTLVWVGRVDPIKDLETLVRSFALVVEEVPRARLRIFGGTPKGNEAYRDEMKQLAGDLGLFPALSFEGRVDPASDAYAVGHVVVLTSISEGFPYTVIEAMSSGCATVSTDVGGVAEAVNTAGLVVPPRDPAAVAEACVKLLQDDQYRREMGKAARNRVLELFTLDRSLDSFRQLYTSLVSHHEPVLR